MNKKIILLLISIISIGIIYVIISIVALSGVIQPPMEVQGLMHRYDTFTAWWIYLGL